MAWSISGATLERYYIPVIAPVGVIGNAISFLVWIFLFWLKLDVNKVNREIKML